MTSMEWKWKRNDTLYLPPPTNNPTMNVHSLLNEPRADDEVKKLFLQSPRNHNNEPQQLSNSFTNNERQEEVLYLRPLPNRFESNINWQYGNQSAQGPTLSPQQNIIRNQFERLRQSSGRSSAPSAPTLVLPEPISSSNASNFVPNPFNMRLPPPILSTPPKQPSYSSHHIEDQSNHITPYQHHHPSQYSHFIGREVSAPTRHIKQNLLSETPQKKLTGPHHHKIHQSNHVEGRNIMRFPLSEAPTVVFDQVVSSGSNPVADQLSANENGKFHLLEQPDEMQRKSYKKENRCLHPNPLVICKRENFNAEITDGIVSVKLVDSEGKELPHHKSSSLESIDGGLSHPLDKDDSTAFSLKILQTSQGQMFRLQFTVSYRMKGVGNVEEKILSEPFGVYSNKYDRDSRRKRAKTCTFFYPTNPTTKSEPSNN